MRGLWLFNFITYSYLLSPPFLVGFAWVGYFKCDDKIPQPRWRRKLGAVNLVAVSALLTLCVVRFLGYRCNADAGDWSCVTAWKPFAGAIVRLAPIFCSLQFLVPNALAILTFILVLVIVFDVFLVDMMA